MSRRGKGSKIFTDNARNFVGANSQLKVFCKTFNFPDQTLAAYFTEEGIEWNFIPPRAPHMGGLWEAGIKSVKYHLKRALGRSRLTYEEFETMITQVEGILIPDPFFTPISNDFDNFEVLTPAHFLIGRSINSILEPLVINISDNRLSRWQKTTKEDFTPVCNWLLGRVVEVYHGSDGKCSSMWTTLPWPTSNMPCFLESIPQPYNDTSCLSNSVHDISLCLPGLPRFLSPDNSPNHESQ
ncbi:DUF5641 domain-containing protein [Trichonephila clavipes]|uniref:DUF5641 domain-containing protein n=1 Tax=Trichonephila clavipes TaxID=2585209 RepID=A0A8X6VCG2_TRICX|nr:DUF5641 domain-containing protein [Trichonephila clavipes]